MLTQAEPALSAGGNVVRSDAVSHAGRVHGGDHTDFSKGVFHAEVTGRKEEQRHHYPPPPEPGQVIESEVPGNLADFRRVRSRNLGMSALHDIAGRTATPQGPG